MFVRFLHSLTFTVSLKSHWFSLIPGDASTVFLFFVVQKVTLLCAEGLRTRYIGVCVYVLCRRLHCCVQKGCAEGIYFSITQKTKA